jgi:histidinol phosphatase-like enzyme
VLANDAARLEAVVGGPVEHAVCRHPGGPPTCWCRPPLPGLPLAFARRHGVELSRSILVGASAAHRTLAATLGAQLASSSSESTSSSTAEKNGA